MEVRIRTYDETSSERVTIGLAPGQRVEIELAGQSLAPGTEEALRERIAELEARLDRYQRAHVCTVECRPNQHTAFQGRQLAEQLKDELETALGTLKVREEQVLLLKEELCTAQSDARADERAQWEDRLATERRLRHEIGGRLLHIRNLVNRPRVDDFLDDHEELGGLVKAIRHILSEPEGDNSTT